MQTFEGLTTLADNPPPTMTTSDSSDSEPEPDLDADYCRVTGETPAGSEAINQRVCQDENAEDPLIRFIEKSVENSASIPQIKVEGSGTKIYPGIHIHPRDNPPPAEDFLQNIEETKRLEKIVGGIRDYYHTVRDIRQ